MSRGSVAREWAFLSRRAHRRTQTDHPRLRCFRETCQRGGTSSLGCLDLLRITAPDMHLLAGAAFSLRGCGCSLSTGVPPFLSMNISPRRLLAPTLQVFAVHPGHGGVRYAAHLHGGGLHLRLHQSASSRPRQREPDRAFSAPWQSAGDGGLFVALLGWVAGGCQWTVCFFKGLSPFPLLPRPVVTPAALLPRGIGCLGQTPLASLVMRLA